MPEAQPCSCGCARSVPREADPKALVFASAWCYGRHTAATQEAPQGGEGESVCTHCGEPVRAAAGDWIHIHGLYRCQSPDVPYGHLAHPASVPCRADGPNPCLGATAAPQEAPEGGEGDG